MQIYEDQLKQQASNVQPQMDADTIFTDLARQIHGNNERLQQLTWNIRAYCDMLQGGSDEESAPRTGEIASTGHINRLTRTVETQHGFIADLEYQLDRFARLLESKQVPPPPPGRLG